MAREYRWWITLVLLAAIVVPSFPAVPVHAQPGEPVLLAEPETIPPDPEADLPIPITVPPPETPDLPSLTLQLEVTPQGWVGVGDTITATLTVQNQAPYPAEDLRVTLTLPTDAAVVDATDPAFTGNGWTWNAPPLGEWETIQVTATMQLTTVPIGEALVLEPEVTARGLDRPVVAIGGALVTTEASERDAAGVSLVGESVLTDSLATVTNDESLVIAVTTDDTALATATSGTPLPPRANPRARFTPGQPARLQSHTGRVTVELPGRAFDAPLTLDFRSPAEQRPLFQTRGQQEPPAIAGHRRGFGAFYLEATDDQGRDVHRFQAPLTIQVRFTAQQLRVLNIAPDDLTLFWFDEQAQVTDPAGRMRQGQWVPLQTTVDPIAGTATASVDHFTGFQLSDGSSPSAAYLPSLQGWQVSGFTGAASFSYPIDVPAGPGGLKPDLSLSYSSAATDGVGGMRTTNQAGWVGKGWSLDTGSVALQKIEVSGSTTVNHYALSFNGRSFDLIRGAARVINPQADNPTHWNWHPTDESYIRIDVVSNGNSTPGSAGAPGRGAKDYGTPYERYKWIVWDQSGTRYEFDEDIWWGWANCVNPGAFAYFESNRWLLSTITDPSGNVIDYDYARSNVYYDTCLSQSGTVDLDVWPTTITWGGGRYQVQFTSSIRTSDTQIDHPAYTLNPVRQTRRLDAIKVFSKPASAWELMREYRLTYDYSLYSDARKDLGGGLWGAETTHPKLTLKTIQRVGSNGTTGLPITTFSYNTSGGSAFDPNGGWNRVTIMNNGQGGTQTITYANMAVAISGADHFRNRHRVTSREMADGRGNSYTWSYAYGTPRVNDLGTNLGDGVASGAHPSSAVLYYNIFRDGDADDDAKSWLVHPMWQEFRGHSWMEETDPSGGKTKQFLYQGDAGCTPASTAKGSHAAITGDACFQSMLRREFLKGKPYQTDVRDGSTLLTQTVREYEVGTVDYSWAPLSGLWKAFSYERAVDERVYEGGSTASTKRTEYYYNTGCSWTAALDAYGRLSCIIEHDRGTIVRKTIHAYGTLNTASQYIVDRNIATSIVDSAGRYLAHSQRFYDGNNTVLGTLGNPTQGWYGLLTREIQISNVPFATGVADVQLNGRDTTYTYDGDGNPKTTSSYPQSGWVKFVTASNAWTASNPGNGSTARTTTTTYETTFNVFPTQITNPLGQSQSAGYDYRMGTLTSVTDANNVTTTAIYDVFGRLHQVIKPGEGSNYTTRALYYDSETPFRYRVDQWQVVGSTDTRFTQQFYDGLGRQIQTKLESNGTTQSIVTDMRYDGLGRVTQQSQPRYVAETSTSYVQYTAVPSSGMRWTTTTYDALGRPKTITAPDNSVTAHFYGVDTSSLLRWHDVVNANRHRTQTRTDALGRMVTVYELNGNCGLWSYTCSGAFTTSWAIAATTSYAYSPLDLLTAVEDAKGNDTSMTYDSLGRKLTMSDPDMGNWSYVYDANGNLTRQNDARGKRICFYYDALDRPTGRHFRTDNSCPSTHPYSTGDVRYTYDSGTYGKGHRTGMSVNGGASTTWAYDNRGRTVSVSHTAPGISGSRLFAYTYDSGDRLRSITYPSVGGTTEKVNYGYDSAWRQRYVCIDGTNGCYSQIDAFDALSQPLDQEFGNLVRTQSFYNNSMARLSQLQVGTATTANAFFDRSYTYDPIGNIARITDTKLAAPQTFRYDERDRLISASAIAQPIPSGTVVTVRARGEDVDGWPTMQLRINGSVVQTWTVNSATWANYTYTLTAALDSDDIVDILYTNNYSNGIDDRDLFVDYIQFGSVQTIQAESRAVSIDRNATDGKEVFASDGNLWWNAAIRLTERYSYDSLGNLTNKADLTMTYGANGNGTGAGPHQARVVGGQTYSYDANGNLTSSGGRSYSWNSENLPTSITVGGVAETYAYNADSARVTKTRNGVTTAYLEGMWEETSAGVVKKYYTLNGQVIGVREVNGSSAPIAYLHADHLGSVSLSTNGSQQVSGQNEYDPWGKQRQTAYTPPQPYIANTDRNYTGQILDDTGLLFYNARYYDAAIGRFISADSIVPGSGPLTIAPMNGVASNVWRNGGVSGPGSPQLLNRYSYVLNNPLKYTDPTGHHPCAALLAGGPVGAGVAAGCALFMLGVAAVGYAAGQATAAAIENSDIPKGSPASSDTGGQTNSPGGANPNDPNDLENLVANKGRVEIREKTQQGTGRGTPYETYLQNKLGGSRGFEARRTGSGQFRDFDGAYRNGKVWYEAKDQVWSPTAIDKFFSQAGEQIRIAQAAGREYQLISRQAIPDAVKQWLTNRGASYREIP